MSVKLPKLSLGTGQDRIFTVLLLGLIAVLIVGLCGIFYFALMKPTKPAAPTPTQTSLLARLTPIATLTFTPTPLLTPTPTFTPVLAGTPTPTLAPVLAGTPTPAPTPTPTPVPATTPQTGYGIPLLAAGAGLFVLILILRKLRS